MYGVLDTSLCGSVYRDDLTHFIQRNVNFDMDKEYLCMVVTQDGQAVGTISMVFKYGLDIFKL